MLSKQSVIVILNFHLELRIQISKCLEFFGPFATVSHYHLGFTNTYISISNARQTDTL